MLTNLTLIGINLDRAKQLTITESKIALTKKTLILTSSSFFCGSVYMEHTIFFVVLLAL